jgi:hypothetical protein
MVKPVENIMTDYTADNLVGKVARVLFTGGNPKRMSEERILRTYGGNRGCVLILYNIRDVIASKKVTKKLNRYT